MSQLLYGILCSQTLAVGTKYEKRLEANIQLIGEIIQLYTPTTDTGPDRFLVAFNIPPIANDVSVIALERINSSVPVSIPGLPTVVVSTTVV